MSDPVIFIARTTGGYLMVGMPKGAKGRAPEVKALGWRWVRGVRGDGPGTWFTKDESVARYAWEKLGQRGPR